MIKIIRLALSLGLNFRLRPFIILLAMLSLPALACSMPTIPDLPFFGSDVFPTPAGYPDPSSGDAMTYHIPIYGTRLQPGETIPGTQLTYVGKSGGFFEVNLNGEQALKQSGDSFFWSGVMGPGVFANYKLRLTTSILGGMPVAGPIDLVVLNPQPLAVDSVDGLDVKYHYKNLLLDWDVPIGQSVPGTTLLYEGMEEQGVGDEKIKMARIGGLGGHPLIATGDSLSWRGRLRDNVIIRYSLRALSYDEESIHLFGTGELWITN